MTTANDGSAAPGTQRDVDVPEFATKFAWAGDPDEFRDGSQRYVCISVVAPEGTLSKADVFAVKLRGVFSDIKAAKAHCEAVSHMDQHHDVYVCSMYEWLVMPPPVESIEYARWHNDKLNKLFDEKKANAEKAREMFKERIESAHEDVEEEALREQMKKDNKKRELNAKRRGKQAA